MSVKQDGSMVRTAQDLERKYKLAEIQKAFEQSEKTITRINQIVQDFVNTVVGTLDNFEGLSDGHITTYFFDGIPTLETEPTISWENPSEEHINDLYYDRDTGKAYTFVNVDGLGTYEWIEVEDKNKVKVLALANATVDTKDHQRRLFLEQPKTPYDNGDLWLKDGVIYACQISKPSTEEYEEHDFIVSSQYAGDTLAIKIGTELEVLRGTVLKVVEDASQLRVDLTDLDKDKTSSIEFLMNSLTTLIVGADGQTMMKQDGDKIYFEMKDIIETLTSTSEKVTDLDNGMSDVQGSVATVTDTLKKLEEKTSYVATGSIDGVPYIELGTDNANGFKVRITNEEILFLEGSSVPAHISNETLHVSKASVGDLFTLGNFSIVKRGNNHISIAPKGVIE